MFVVLGEHIGLKQKAVQHIFTFKIDHLLPPNCTQLLSKELLKAFFKVHIKEHSVLFLFIYQIHALHRSNKFSPKIFKLILFSF